MTSPVWITRRSGLAWIAQAALTTMLPGGRAAARSAAAAVPAPKPDRLARISAFFANEVATGRLPGAVVLIQQHGRPVYRESFGLRDVAGTAPMTPDTLFALHSMTKPITSVAAMMLIDAGKLALHDPVANYIPAFATTQVGVEAMSSDWKPVLKLVPPNRAVTIRDLLRHTSGITYEYIGGELIERAYMKADLFAGAFDNAVFAERIAGLPLARQPGTLWRYGHSTDVLGRVIEIVAGEPLGAFLQRRLFDPLGMGDTVFVVRDTDRARMAEPLPSDSILLAAEHQRRAHPEWQSGGGGLVSTVTDYARFAQMILQGGEHDGRRYLSAAAFRAMTTDQIGPGSGVARDYFYFPGDGFGYGYGFAVRVEPGEARPPAPGSIGELKWDSGSGTLFGVDPKLDMTYVLMQQTQNERGRIVPAFKRLVYDAFAVSD